MLLAQQIFAHEYSAASYSPPWMSAFDLQRIEISFFLDFLLSDSLAVVLGIHAEHTVAENSALVLDLAVLYLQFEKFSWFLSAGVMGWQV